jgi:23S rRNA (pseudouridine1915-N3)-methyltransferase
MTWNGCGRRLPSAATESPVRLTIVAVGTRMPDWVERGVSEYQRRLPGEIKLQWKEVALANRGRSSSATVARSQEAQAMSKQVPRQDALVALDVKGASWSTPELARQLQRWQMSGVNYSLLIGGPDGIDDELLSQASQRWSLSPLTLPHPLVRVLLVEQLYRAWTINTNHPYHRA